MHLASIQPVELILPPGPSSTHASSNAQGSNNAHAASSAKGPSSARADGGASTGPTPLLSPDTRKALASAPGNPRTHTQRTFPDAWSAHGAAALIRQGGYFAVTAATGEGNRPPGGAGAAGAGGSGAVAPMPAALRAVLPAEEGCVDGVGGVGRMGAALCALGGMVAFLKDSLLDRVVLPLGRIELLPDLQLQV